MSLPQWRRGALWLLGLGPFFFASYNIANWLASRQAHVGVLVYGWENHIPFLPWTIVPYWSIDFFYGLSLFICGTAAELDTHGRRLLTAQILSVSCFILFPLRFSFVRPAADGISGFLFTSLASFDRPFNQAPSLHIALLVILWVLYRRHVPRRWHWLLDGWALLIGVSVLTTYQHHFIDVPTGALAGLFCLWLWPDTPRSAGQRPNPKRARLAVLYGTAAIGFAAIAWRVGGLGLIVFWVSVALTLTAVNYAWLGAEGFQKSPGGRMSLASRWLFAPTWLGAWINSRLWTWREPGPVIIAGNVSLGRLPGRGQAERFTTLIDLCAEMPDFSGHSDCRAWPMLDLVVPPPGRLHEVAQAIAEAQARGPVLVCCALGYARSAAAVATWLLASGRCRTPDEALAVLQLARAGVVLRPDGLAVIAAASRG